MWQLALGMGNHLLEWNWNGNGGSFSPLSLSLSPRLRHNSLKESEWLSKEQRWGPGDWPKVTTGTQGSQKGVWHRWPGSGAFMGRFWIWLKYRANRICWWDKYMCEPRITLRFGAWITGRMQLIGRAFSGGYTEGKLRKAGFRRVKRHWGGGSCCWSLCLQSLRGVTSLIYPWTFSKSF